MGKPTVADFRPDGESASPLRYSLTLTVPATRGFCTPFHLTPAPGKSVTGQATRSVCFSIAFCHRKSKGFLTGLCGGLVGIQYQLVSGWTCLASCRRNMYNLCRQRIGRCPSYTAPGPTAAFPSPWLCRGCWPTWFCRWSGPQGATILQRAGAPHRICVSAKRGG